MGKFKSENIVKCSGMSLMRKLRTICCFLHLLDILCFELGRIYLGGKTVTSHASEAFTCRQAFGLYETIFLPGIREAGYVTPHRVSHSGNWSIWRLCALVKVQQFRSGLLALWVQGILEKYCMLHSRNVAGGFTHTGISKGSIPFLFCFPCPYPPPPVLPSPHLLLFSSSPHQISFFFFFFLFGIIG